MAISFQRGGDVPILDIAEALEGLMPDTRKNFTLPGDMPLRVYKDSETSYYAELELPDGETETRHVPGVAELLAWAQEVQDRLAGDVTTGGTKRASEDPAIASDDDTADDATGAGSANDAYGR
jgi:hypothetical protein